MISFLTTSCMFGFNRLCFWTTGFLSSRSCILCLQNDRHIPGISVVFQAKAFSSLTGLELVQETTDKVVLVKEKPISGERSSKELCWLRLPEELSYVHDTFHVPNLEKKCLADASLHVSLDEIKVDKTLRFVEEPVKNSGREVKRLKCSRMVVVKFLFDELRDQVVNDVVTQRCYANPFGGQAKLLSVGYLVKVELRLLVKSRDEISLRRGYCDNHDLSRFVLVFVEAAKHQILGGDQLLVILCGYGTKSLELGTSFLSITMLFVDRGTRSVPLPKVVVNAARPKAVVNAVKGNNVNVVKASACWVWKPKTKVLGPLFSKHNRQSTIGFTGSWSVLIVDVKHMIRKHVLFLQDYEEIDGGYGFGLWEGNSKGGKITGKSEAVNTACYVQNRVLVVKPHNMTPYELFHGRTLTLSFMRPFGCPVTILNTIDHLGKINGKADEGFIIGNSLNRSGPNWLFNIDALTRTMSYEPIVAGTQSNDFAGTKASDNAGQARKKTKHVKDYILLPLWTEDNVNSTYNVNGVSINEVNAASAKTSIELPIDLDLPELEDISIFDLLRDDEDVGAEADMNNLDTTIQVSPIPTTRIHKDHPLDQVIGDLQSATQTRRMSKNLEEHRRTQKGNSCIEGSKLDRGYAGRAYTIQVTRSLDFSGFTKWKKG
ncbi:hypothetical protein Tco_0438692 [Tanacetum coccineum]